MARIRTLKPDAIQHRKVGRLSDRAFRCWVGMLTQADDEGRVVADPEQLRVLIFGYHPKTTTSQVDESMREIVSLGLIRIYSKNGTQYADFPSWKDHQRIKKPNPSKLPSHDECSTSSPPVPHQYPTSTEPLSTSPPPEGNGREGSSTLAHPAAARSGFDGFWATYPRKKSKGQAERAWVKLHPDEQLQGTILLALERAKTSDWKERELKHIPYPATWLNAKGWEDEILDPAGLRRSETESRLCRACQEAGEPIPAHLWRAGHRLEACPAEPAP